MKAICISCGYTKDLGDQVGGKIGLGLVGAVLGGGATKHPGGLAAGLLLGALIGHVIDTNLPPICPNCRIALQIAAVL